MRRRDLPGICDEHDHTGHHDHDVDHLVLDDNVQFVGEHHDNYSNCDHDDPGDVEHHNQFLHDLYDDDHHHDDHNHDHDEHDDDHVDEHFDHDHIHIYHHNDIDGPLQPRDAFDV